MDYSQTKIKLIPVLYMMCLHLSITSTTGYVVLSPQGNYTVFENNTLAIFNCSGGGYAVGWYLNGSAYNAVHVQRGIIVVPATPTGGVVSSTLFIPSKSMNNNTEVLCKVVDATFSNIQTSEPANLTIQGPLGAPYNFSVVVMSTSLTLSWGAPFSLDVIGYSDDIFNYSLCTNITIYGCKTIPSDPDCTFPRTCTSSVDFTDPSLNGTNKTIMDNGDSILFTFAAINGAGIGNRTEYIFIYDTDSRIEVSPSTTETVRSAVSTISYANNSNLSIGAVHIGLISGAATIVVLFLVIATLPAITFVKRKRKAQFEHNELIHVHAGSSHADSASNYYSTQQAQVEDPYFLSMSNFRPTTSQDQSAEAASSVPVAQPSERISSTPPPKYDNVVSPVESNKVEQTEPPKHMSEAHSIPSSKGGIRIECDEDDDDVTHSHPSSVIRHRNPVQHCTESNGDEESIEDKLKEFETDNIPKAYLYVYSSGNRSQPLRRIECDGDDEYDVEEKSMPKVEGKINDDMPKAYKYPSGNRSQPLCRVECDADDEDVEGTTIKKDNLQVSSSASHESSSQYQQCTEYDEDDENDWCKNSTTEKEATVPQQFTSGVFYRVETGCDDSKQRTNQRTIAEIIKCAEKTSCTLSFTYLKAENIEGQIPSKESNISDNTDEGRPQYVSPTDIRILSSILHEPSVTVIEVNLETSDSANDITSLPAFEQRVEDDEAKSHQLKEVHIVLCGHTSTGKSTLTQAIINLSKPTATRLVKRVLGRQDVVEPLTAGIIPHQVDSPYSNMFIYDLAGHNYYFSSHSACLEAISLQSPAIFLLLQDLRKDSGAITRELCYWSAVIDGVCHRCPPYKSSVIVVGTHADLLTPEQVITKLTTLQFIAKMSISHQKLVLSLNLTKLYSNQMDQFRDLLNEIRMCPSIPIQNQLMLAKFKEKLPPDADAIHVSLSDFVEQDFDPFCFIATLFKIIRARSATVPNISLGCSMFYAPHFHDVLSLEFPLPMVQATLSCRGIEWLSKTGVSTIVEMSETFQSLSMAMSFPDRTDPKYLELAHHVPAVIKKACEEFCPHVEVLDMISCSPEASSDHCEGTKVELSLLKEALVRGDKYIVDVSGQKHVEVGEWLKIEPCLLYIVEVPSGAVPSPSELASQAMPQLEGVLVLPPSLADLMNEVASVIPAKWRAVGIQLGLAAVTLNIIQTENAGKPQAYRESIKQMYSIWKRQDRKPYIFDVLRTPAVGQSASADVLSTLKTLMTCVVHTP